MKTMKKVTLTLIVGLALIGLADSAIADKNAPLAALGKPPIPADNPQTAAKAALGKLLFFDPRIGGDASLSCADCHSPTQGWGFADPISRGYPGAIHWRNSQSVVNTAY
ncbi:MAG TPA: cytochrome-c peroxidase, partial [Rhodospirillales bacterium]|nr:cytochrome-c peroxidase [Rhodospirillales bacterium]